MGPESRIIGVIKVIVIQKWVDMQGRMTYEDIHTKGQELCDHGDRDWRGVSKPGSISHNVRLGDWLQG